MIKLIIFSCLLSSVAFSQENTQEISQQKTSPEEVTIKEAKQGYLRLIGTKYVLLPHKGTYLLPYVYNPRPNEDLYTEMKKISKNPNADYYKKEEAEFQISFMVPIQNRIFDTHFDLNMAYTHHAYWQLYNRAYSRPFRETNYMPEIFLRYLEPSTSSFLGIDLISADVGFVHQSNGQVQAISRSWNRIYARTFLQSLGFKFIATAWYRIPEKKEDDDNSDIYKYLGYGEFEVAKTLGKHTITLKTPIAFHHLSLDLKYSYPWKENLRWYVSVQEGYGHSLIEYNRRTQRFGAGIVLDSFLDMAIE